MEPTYSAENQLDIRMDTSGSDESSGEQQEHFSLQQWMNAQDVSERDDSLDEECARMYMLHRILTSEGYGRELALAIVRECRPAFNYIVGTMASAEPRFSVMALVDILHALGSSEEQSSVEDELASAMKIIVSYVPVIVDNLCNRAREGDVCPDAMYYTLTLLSFFLGESGCRNVEDLHLIRGVATQKWLKVVMRVWKERDLAEHSPGDASKSRGLGYLVTLYLEKVTHYPIDSSVDSEDMAIPTVLETFGIPALNHIARWFVSFVWMRLYTTGVSEDERARLSSVLWRCAMHDFPGFGTKHIFTDRAALMALCNSALQSSHPAPWPILKDNTGAGTVGKETHEKFIRALTLSGYGVFMHLRLFQSAVLRLTPTDRHGFMQLTTPMTWFVETLEHCGRICHSLSATVSHVPALSRLSRLYCCIAALSTIVWEVVKWLCFNSIPVAHPPAANTLTRPALLARLESLCSLICSVSPAALQCRIAGSVLRALRSSAPLSTSPAFAAEGDASAQLPFPPAQLGAQVCEWCFVSDVAGDARLRACSGCGVAHFCSAEHLRLAWRRWHRAECGFLQGRLWGAGAALRVGANSELEDRARGERVGTAWKRDGAEIVMKRYGAEIAGMGGGLVVSPGGRVEYVSRGVFLREVRQRWAKLEFVLRAMVEAVGEMERGCVLVRAARRAKEEPEMEGEEEGCGEGEVSFQVVRVRTRREHGVSTRCGLNGCYGHDEVCTFVVTEQQIGEDSS